MPPGCPSAPGQHAPQCIPPANACDASCNPGGGSITGDAARKPAAVPDPVRSAGGCAGGSDFPLSQAVLGGRVAA
eukprot:5402082-Pyramimonas_sp.AAC.1